MRADPQSRQAQQHWNEGLALARKGRWEDAAGRFAQAARLRPREAVYALNLGRARLHQGRLDDALAAGRQALAGEPGSPIACAFVAHCLSASQRHAEVLEVLETFPDGAAKDIDFHMLRAQSLESLRRWREAIEVYMCVLALRIDDAVAHARMGYCFNHLNMKEEAAQCFRTARALGVGEHDLNVLGMLVFREREVCRWVDSQADLGLLEREVQALPGEADRPLLAFGLLSLFDDPALHRRAAASAARFLSRGVKALPPLPSAPLAGRRIRIGYLSADFFHHATCILMAGMLEAHDKARFEITLYSYGEIDDSALRRRVVAAADRVVELGALDDAAAARLIRDDQLDLLVDLKGYTRDARFEILAHRPAPLQVSFLGYPGTTGASFLDYVIGDPVVTPIEHAAHYSEQIAQMPLCYQPNDSHRPLPPAAARADCGLPENVRVLCGFNQPYKISPEVFDTWCSVLRAAPDTVLWLLDWNEQARKNLEPQAQARGVDPARLVWAPLLPYERHIARLRNAELFLDTWPYNAHTTASDALWAGVPVLTVRGRSFASRVAASLNHAVGLDELVFDTPQALAARALALLGDRTALSGLRARLDARRGSAVFDSERFARDLEALFSAMVERRAAGLPPAPLPASAVS